jgi:hypothetical protein
MTMTEVRQRMLGLRMDRKYDHGKYFCSTKLPQKQGEMTEVIVFEQCR